MRHIEYVLNGHTPVPTDDQDLLVEFWRSGNRTVAVTELAPNAVLSTVFLVIDHNFSLKGPPILFETMLFVDGESVDCRRFSTWDEAEEFHHVIVKAVKNRLPELIERRCLPCPR